MVEIAATLNNKGDQWCKRECVVPPAELLLGIFKKEPTPPCVQKKGPEVFAIGPFSGSTELLNILNMEDKSK